MYVCTPHTLSMLQVIAALYVLFLLQDCAGAPRAVNLPQD